MQWKKLFERSKIKNADPAPTPEIHPYSKIMVSGPNACGCYSAQRYIDCYIIGAKSGCGCENKLYVGDLDRECPDTHLYINGQYCGQILGVGDIFDDRTTIMIKTSSGSFYVRKQQTIHPA